MKRTISTLGYEGATIEQFVGTLKLASVTLLIDVRDLPLSRKKGFSKNQLADVMGVSGIKYVHLRGLGDPKEGRAAARAGNYALFEKIFGRHMRSAVAARDLEIAAKLTRDARACLMCFEADYEKCHRSIVAGHLARKTGLTVTPLLIQDSRMGQIAA
jgi:uncharacterized protein (DUF488 family)